MEKPGQPAFYVPNKYADNTPAAQESQDNARIGFGVTVAICFGLIATACIGKWAHGSSADTTG